ncbi:MAG: allantoinase AllB [Candidatus Acidiferrales bacterium]
MSLPHANVDAHRPPDSIVRGRRVVTPEGERPAAIHVASGVIQAIASYDDIPPGVPLHDAGDSVVMPGLVDTHVHINEPGRTEWEGFSTATRAAAAGGVTTLIEMPLNSIPATTTASAFREKTAAAAGKLWVDVGFWGGVVPDNIAGLAPLWDAGVFGFKCFLTPSGVDEFRHVIEADLRAAIPVLASLDAPLLAHSELPEIIAAATATLASAPPRAYATWLASHPREAENEAIALLLRLAHEFHARVHIVHVSSADALDLLRNAKSKGGRISAETCPHYLTFAAEEIPDGATEFKCAPPIREAENRERLWSALADGTLDFVATDHSPCPPSMKHLEQGDFMGAWGGVASLQLSLPAVWTQAHARGYAVPQLAAWLCGGPAKLAGLDKQKGTIEMGCDADLVVWNPDASFSVDPARLHHRHKVTPYAGRRLHGIVETTFLRGRKIFDRGDFSGAPIGQILRRGAA